MIYRKYIKRILDVLLSLVAIVLLSPLLAVLAVMVRVKLGAPVIFHQERPGKDGKIFRLCKFRTMTDRRDENGELLPDPERLTNFGSRLRRTSLDELPELFNIFKGDMSIVGPRPLFVSYLPYYTERERLRHTVRPGLTGLAQVSGRNFLDWDNRLEKDAEYVEKLSFAEDVSIIGKTFGAVFGHKEQVAVDTNAVEGNLAQIRQDRINGREHPNTQRGNA
jgi:lipopolysaccharide/colanic/teichoic acid biosynthesis glycosyltransferase